MTGILQKIQIYSVSPLRISLVMEKEAESVLSNCNPIIKRIENVTNCLEFIFCLKENDKKKIRSLSVLPSQKKE